MNILPAEHTFEWLIRPANVISRYIEALILPIHLVPDAYFHSTEWRWPALAASVLILPCSFILYRKQDKHLTLFSLALILIPILPFANLIQTGGQFANRYIYLSCAGWALWLGLFIRAIGSELKQRALLNPTALLIALAFPLLASYTYQTYTQSQIWKDELQFWAYAVEKSPHKANTLSEYGSALARAGQLDEAVLKFEDALRISPEYEWPKRKLADLKRDLNHQKSKR